MIARHEIVVGLALTGLLTAACGGRPPTGPTSDRGPEPSAATWPAPMPAPPPRSSPGGAILNGDFGGRQLFPADNWWNQEISAAPLDPRSDAARATRGLGAWPATLTAADFDVILLGWR